MANYALPLVLAMAVAAAPMVEARAQAAGAPCRPTRSGVEQCGQGEGALRLIEGTTSPSGRLALAWRAPAHDPARPPNPDDVENHVVRLSDGLPLTQTAGGYWAADSEVANHKNVVIAWSPDSRWLLVGNNAKWTVDSMAVYAIDRTDRMSGPLDVLATVSTATDGALVRLQKKAKADDYSMLLSRPPASRVSSSGRFEITVVRLIPKQDTAWEFVVRLDVRRTGDRLEAKLVSTAPVPRAKRISNR